MFEHDHDELEQIMRELERIFGDNSNAFEKFVLLPLGSSTECLDFLRAVPSGVSAEELLRLALGYRRAHGHPIRDRVEETDAERSENGRLLALLERDVVTTIGEEFRHWVGDSAENAREYMDAARLVQKVVDDTQQAFMDCFVDVTWPSCPRHPNHPLWYHDDAWYCDRDHEALTKLGALDSIGAGATGREARRTRDAEPRQVKRRRKPKE
jgi:hypothetical protein